VPTTSCGSLTPVDELIMNCKLQNLESCGKKALSDPNEDLMKMIFSENKQMSVPSNSLDDLFEAKINNSS